MPRMIDADLLLNYLNESIEVVELMADVEYARGALKGFTSTKNMTVSLIEHEETMRRILNG
jgi:hypothetical protein